MDPKEFAPNAVIHDTYMMIPIGDDKDKKRIFIKIESGGQCCNKCGDELPPKELYCLSCYGKYPESKVRYGAPKPDEPGNMFEGL